jgi:hypothetical protein
MMDNAAPSSATDRPMIKLDAVVLGNGGVYYLKR